MYDYCQMLAKQGILKKLQDSVIIERKKRHAQLTRLHHQLQEAQTRRRQWHEERTRLHTIITDLKAKNKEE